MEVISYNLKIISRGKGRSVISAAAYCSGEKLYNHRNGLSYFEVRQDVVYKEIFLPGNASENFHDRSTLWNSVERIEKADNSRTARQLIVALYRQLDRDEQISLIVEYVKETFVSQGMCADVCVHDKGDGNPHAHVLLTTRSLDERGNWLGKQRKNYILDEHGSKIYDPVKKQYKCGRSIKTNDWDKEGNVEKWREEWAKACNRAFERKGIKKRVTHESYRLQGEDREATIHLGPKVSALRKRGVHTSRSIINLNIQARNMEREELERQNQRENEYSR